MQFVHSVLFYQCFHILFHLVSGASNPIGPNPNSKRGLLFIPNNDTRQDDTIWIQQDSPLTWYYNYKTKPSIALEGGPTNLQFVPMLWGDYNNTFVEDVQDLIEEGYDIQYVMGFNEPDNPASAGTGGSGIDPIDAAARWRESVEPLASMGLGIKFGAPSPTGAPSGREWMKSFFEACSNCTFDFIPLHWYGDFEGFASHLWSYASDFPDHKFWITEVAFSDQTVDVTQAFFNLTIDYLDKTEIVERYTWFGAFRSDVSNVGPNVAFLDQDGGLTYLGAWYLNKDIYQAASISGESMGVGRPVVSMFSLGCAAAAAHILSLCVF